MNSLNFRFGVAVPVLGMAILWLAFAPAARSADAAGGATRGVPQNRLEREKERAEIAKLRAEVDNSSGIRGFLTSYAAFLTALTALAGVGIAVQGQNREQNRQRDADRKDREQARQQREAESARDLAERMSKLLLDLGSDSEPVQAGAAVSLLSFLGDDPEMHHQVRIAVLANLKVGHPEAVTKLLIRTFEQAVSNADEMPLRSNERDLSGAQLFEAELVELDLSGANISGANLTQTDFSRSCLRDVRGEGAILNGAILQGAETNLFNARLPRVVAVRAQFQGADLVNAHLEQGDLRNARFDGARLQAAHIEFGADLRGARFDGANVADTYFREARFDDDALRSLRKADNWEKAHLSPTDAHRLKEIET